MRPTKNRHGKAIAAVRTHKEGSIPSLEDSVPKPLGFNAFGQNCPSGFPYTSATLVNFTERLNYPQPIGRVHGVHVWPDFRCPLRPKGYSTSRSPQTRNRGIYSEESREKHPGKIAGRR